MLTDKIQIYWGNGVGRSAAAMGMGLRYVCAGKNVMVVCFLKGKDILKQDYLKRLEPELKVFSFDKFDRCYNDLSEEEKKEMIGYLKRVEQNIRGSKENRLQ